MYAILATINLIKYDVFDKVKEYINGLFSVAIEAAVNGAVSIWNFFMEIAFNILTTDPFTIKAGGKTVFQLISTQVGTGIVDVSIALTTLIWMIGFGREAVHSVEPMRNVESMFPVFCRLLIPTFLIAKYKDITDLILTAGRAAMETISPAAPVLKVNVNAYINPDRINATSLLLGLFIAIIFIIVVAATGIKVVLSVFGRFLKIFCVVLIAPIGLAMFSSRNTEMWGMRYLEGLAKISLECVVIALCLQIYAVFMTTVASDGTSLLIGDTGGMGINPFLYFVIQILYVSVLGALISGADQICERYL